MCIFKSIFVCLAVSCALFHSRDAWNALGDMPKDEAMENYVNEIKKVCKASFFMQNLPSPH